MHGDTTAFALAAAILILGAAIAAALYEHGTKALKIKPDAAPVAAH